MHSVCAELCAFFGAEKMVLLWPLEEYKEIWLMGRSIDWKSYYDLNLFWDSDEVNSAAVSILVLLFHVLYSIILYCLLFMKCKKHAKTKTNVNTWINPSLHVNKAYFYDILLWYDAVFIDCFVRIRLFYKLMIKVGKSY